MIPTAFLNHMCIECGCVGEVAGHCCLTCDGHGGWVVPQVYWASRHQPSPAQVKALQDLHGHRVEILQENVIFDGPAGLTEYIRSKQLEHPNQNPMVYAVGNGAHYLEAAFAGLRFGVMMNHPKKRHDGSFGLASVYVANYPEQGQGQIVWVNNDPDSDEGEPLLPDKTVTI